MNRFITILLLSISCLAQTGGGAVLGGGAKISNVPAAISPVVQAHIAVGSFGANPSTTIAFSSNVVSGHILVAYAAGSSAISAWSLPTGSGTGCASTSWTAQGSPSTGASVNGSVWTGAASGSGACTITISGTATSAWIAGAAYETTKTSVTGLVISTYAVSSCTSCTGQTLTTSVPSMVLTFFAGGNSGPYSAPSPFSLDINANDSQADSVGAGNFVQSASGLYSPTWTATNFAAIGNVSVAIP